MKLSSVLFFSFFAFAACTENNAGDKSIASVAHEDTLRNTKPVDFLKSLRNTSGKEEWKRINPASMNWVKKQDIPTLMAYLDSNRVKAYYLFSSVPGISSFVENDHGYSTLAKEAFCMIESYRFKEQYPPCCTIPLTYGAHAVHDLPDSLIEEMRNWWKSISDASKESSESEEAPVLDVSIRLENEIVSYGKPIFLNIRLKNNLPKIQKVLFDRPVLSTGGPWGLAVSLTDEQGRSLVKYGNREVLSSQTYTETKLRDNYYYLGKGQSVSGEYELEKLVVLESDSKDLPRGKYRIQVSEGLNVSNEVDLTVK
jgi:hypothetical protein